MRETMALGVTILALMTAGLLCWLVLSPFEVLGWWAGWFGDSIHGKQDPPVRKGAEAGRSVYVVFFSGVGRATGEILSYRESDFLARLAERLPGAAVISDIFPYAVNNLALTNYPRFGRVWRALAESKGCRVPIAGYLINLRNITQMMISADKRYGPLFNQGVAEVIVEGLMRHGYTLDGTAPVILIGYSGAGQIALGASHFLKQWLKSPVTVVSLGGVFGSDPALLSIDHFYHLVGKRDSVESIWKMAPGRWSIFGTSEWNRALKQGRVTRVEMGPMRHSGRAGYLDATTRLADGRSHVDATVECVCGIVTGAKGRVVFG